MNILEARRRTLGKGVYKKTVEGNPAIAQGSLARRYPGIGMQGWTEQAQYEGNQLFDISKITPGNIGNSNITIDGEKIIVTNGSGSSGVYPKEPNSLLQYCPNIVAGKSYTLKFDTTGTYKSIYIQGYGAWISGQTLNITEQILSSKIAFYASGTDTSATISNFMINEGSTALPYEPYTGGQPSPNPDYPQEIVSAGKWNEETQKWEYEITIANEQTDPDKNQTVTLTADRPLTKWDKLEKRNGQWGWVYKSAEVVLDGGNDEAWTLYTTSAEVISFYTTLYGGKGAKKSSLCDKYINKDYAWNEESLYGIYSDNIGYPGRKYFRPPSADVETVEQWKTWLQSNPLTLWYETFEETFVPLSASEQEQMNALHTFRPTTVLSNDCDCNMILTYKTKKSLEVTT